MSDVVNLVAKALDFELYELVHPSKPWRIFALRGKNAEGLAMLQALYSRSPKSIKDRIDELAAREHLSATDRLSALTKKTRERLNGFLFNDEHASLDSLSVGRKTNLVKILEAAGGELLAGNDKAVSEKMAEFMETYYVAYGHKSIGDCGGIVLFMEGVPFHLLTQVQDSALFSGQEGSSRFMGMSSIHVWDPIGTETSAAIQADWMNFYRTTLPRLIDHLLVAHPRDEVQPEAVYLRAIKARAFDILGAFLPIGGSTNGSWSVNLRQAADHDRVLRHHPDAHVAALGEDIHSILSALHPKSFSHEERSTSNDWLRTAIADQIKLVRGNPRSNTFNVRVLVPDQDRFLRVAEILKTRPARMDIPRHLRNFALVTMEGWLDFRSFRDLHRHRALDIPVPCVEWKDGTIESWYLDMLPPELRAEAEALLARQFARFNTLEADPFTLQMYEPMGVIIPVKIDGPIGALIYMIELRAKSDVHPTVRRAVWNIADAITAQLPSIPMAVDHQPDAFNVKRGEATIIDTRTGHDVAGHSTKEGLD